MNKKTIKEALKTAFAEATKADWFHADWYEVVHAARGTLEAVNAVYPFGEYISEHGNPDEDLRPMEELDELAECGGDWAKPTYILARAFYGYRYSSCGDADGRAREEFNPNDDYFTFNGYGNLVSVNERDWAHYWAGILDLDGYVESADDGVLAELSEALGVEGDGDADGEEG